MHLFIYCQSSYQNVSLRRARTFASHVHCCKTNDWNCRLSVYNLLDDWTQSLHPDTIYTLPSPHLDTIHSPPLQADTIHILGTGRWSRIVKWVSHGFCFWEIYNQMRGHILDHKQLYHYFPKLNTVLPILKEKIEIENTIMLTRLFIIESFKNTQR